MGCRNFLFSCLAIAVCIAELVGCVPQNNQSVPTGTLGSANSQPAADAPRPSESQQVKQQDLANALSEIERMLQQLPPLERGVKQIVRYKGVGVLEDNDFFLQGARAAAATHASESYFAAQQEGHIPDVPIDAGFFPVNMAFSNSFYQSLTSNNQQLQSEATRLQYS
jgi:hypothetical protein